MWWGRDRSRGLKKRMGAGLGAQRAHGGGVYRRWQGGRPGPPGRRKGRGGTWDRVETGGIYTSRLVVCPCAGTGHCRTAGPAQRLQRLCRVNNKKSGSPSVLDGRLQRGRAKRAGGWEWVSADGTRKQGKGKGGGGGGVHAKKSGRNAGQRQQRRAQRAGGQGVRRPTGAWPGVVGGPRALCDHPVGAEPHCPRRQLRGGRPTPTLPAPHSPPPSPRTPPPSNPPPPRRHVPTPAW